MVGNEEDRGEKVVRVGGVGVRDWRGGCCWESGGGGSRGRCP